MALFDLPPKPEPRFWTFLTRLGFALFVVAVLWVLIVFFWPMESSVPFDSAVWKANATAATWDVRSAMRQDLMRRIKTERWSHARTLSELGPADNSQTAERLSYTLGHRRGAWPFRQGRMLTGFDLLSLTIAFDENGIAVGAQASMP